MTLTGYPFLLGKSPDLTPAEQDGLFCLLERAKYFDAAGDILFLCLSSCSVLVRFAPDEQKRWQACGFAFHKGIEEQWVWLFLPALIGSVLTPPAGDLHFSADHAQDGEQWLRRHQPALYDSVQQFKTDTETMLHPHTVGFAQKPEIYGDDSIVWYPVTSGRTIQARIPSVSSVTCEPADDDRYLVPPKLLRGWRIVSGEQKQKLDAVEERNDWHAFYEKISE